MQAKQILEVINIKFPLNPRDKNWFYMEGSDWLGILRGDIYLKGQCREIYYLVFFMNHLPMALDYPIRAI
jgi:hypothetical protein